MINKETILSTSNDKLTLLEWLKKVEEGLAEGVLTSCELVKTARATFKFKLSFEDGTTAESNSLTIEADNIASASFVNGHLVFVTEDGRRIDAGHLSGNLGNIIAEAMDVHGDIYAVGDVNVTGDVNSSNIASLEHDNEGIKDTIKEIKAVLERFQKTQYGLSINEFVTINGNLHVTGDLQVDGQGGGGGESSVVCHDLTINSYYVSSTQKKYWFIAGNCIHVFACGTLQNSTGGKNIDYNLLEAEITKEELGDEIYSKLAWAISNYNMPCGSGSFICYTTGTSLPKQTSCPLIVGANVAKITLNLAVPNDTTIVRDTNSNRFVISAIIPLYQQN